MIGAQVHEPENYEKAIELVVGERLPLDALITAVEPIDRLPEAFAELDANPKRMKVLIDCRG